MKPFAIAVIVITLTTSSTPIFTAPPTQRPLIRGEGCVESDAEARCFAVEDIKSGKLYNLLIKGMQPEIGSGIEFSGILHHGVTTCMQGTPIDVQSWSRKNSLRCTQGTAPRKSH